MSSVKKGPHRTSGGARTDEKIVEGPKGLARLANTMSKILKVPKSAVTDTSQARTHTTGSKS